MVSRCEESLCRRKASHIWFRKKPPRRDFFSHRCFDVAGARMPMGLDGVKEVETEEEDKEVLCS